MKIKIILLLVPLIFLVSCTRYYSKPNLSWTNEEFYADNAECSALCGQAGGAEGCTWKVEHVYESCMNGKGWVGSYSKKK